MIEDFFAKFLDYFRVPGQSEDDVTHVDGRRFVRGDPDARQLRAKLELVGHVASDGPEEVTPGLAIRVISRLAGSFLLFELLVGLVDVAFEEAVDSFTSCEPFFVSV